MARIFNFSAGPAVLPEEVLARAGDEMLDWHGAGRCVMEMSHRGKDVHAIAAEAEKDLRECSRFPPVQGLFLQGGATLQFAQSMNLLAGKGKHDYVNTGEWSKKAIKEAQDYCDVHTPRLPRTRVLRISLQEVFKIRSDAAYLHYCSNETRGGVEAHWIPKRNSVCRGRPRRNCCRARSMVEVRPHLRRRAEEHRPGGLTIVLVA